MCAASGHQHSGIKAPGMLLLVKLSELDRFAKIVFRSQLEK
jgi:hypothetical protein